MKKKQIQNGKPLKGKRLFAIIDSCLKFAPPKFKNHAEWFEAQGWISEMDNSQLGCLRGFVDFRGIYFYSGYEFRFENKDYKAMLKFLPELVAILNLPMETKLFGGIKKDPYRELWPFRKRFGPLSEII